MIYTFCYDDLSKDHKHTYFIRRHWGVNGKCCNFIMLNPTPTERHKDGPTIKKCIHFANKLGCDELCVTNLFSLRTYNPKDLLEDEGLMVFKKRWNTILKEAKKAKHIVVAWGNDGNIRNRGKEVVHVLSKFKKEILCLGINKNGTPKHPLLIRKNTEFIRYI